VVLAWCVGDVGRWVGWLAAGSVIGDIEKRDVENQVELCVWCRVKTQNAQSLCWAAERAANLPVLLVASSPNQCFFFFASRLQHELTPLSHCGGR
jgi:hypothetical protein